MQLDEINRFNSVNTAMMETKYKVDLWEGIISWKELEEVWMTFSFNEFKDKVKEVMNFAEIFDKTAKKCKKNLPENDVVIRFEKMVNKIKVAMPAISAMANPNLEEMHWDEIKYALND